MAARWVKKRDGRIEPYDEARIVRAVLRAGRRYGTAEELERLAREIARAVTLFLARRPERAPDTATVAQAMEEALDETGHGPIASAARDWRGWRRRRQAEVRVRDAAPGAADRSATPVEVLSRTGARPWTKQRIVQALTQQAELERESAEDVARAVEERVFAAGLNQISTTLLRELIDAELFERGFSAQLGRLEVLGLPKPDLEGLAFMGQGRAPLGLEDKVVRAALERYALDDLIAGKGAQAHLRGDLHLLGLGRPFRRAAGAVDAVAVCGGEAPARSPLEVARRLIGVLRRAATSHELMFGVVGLEAALGALAAPDEEVSLALELLLDAVASPCPDDLPPAPEAALVVEASDAGTSARRVVERCNEVLLRRGPEGAGVRLVVRARGPEVGLEGVLRDLVRAAGAGAAIDLVLGEGEGVASRGMLPGVAVVQVAFLNLAGLALAAGRGERRRLSAGIERAAAAAADAFHLRRRHALAQGARPALGALFGVAEGAADGPASGAVVDALAVAGLDAALRYLTGEGPTENPRVAELAHELQGEVHTAIEAAAARLGLGRVLMEDVPERDAGIRLAALDLDRFPDARELLGEASGWATGATFDEALADVRLRLRLARKRGGLLVLTRPVLAAAAEPDLLAAALVEALLRTGTGRIEKNEA
ncbi:MAG: ATP cone domain-containing protein [Planctomycetes bacterium]|nr:ATP cone domain-containing protein [Planctomycetota bacterium]